MRTVICSLGRSATRNPRTSTFTPMAPIDWEPKFTIHGFRYAEITGYTGDLASLRIRGRVYHSDMPRTGWLETSNPALNRLHENVVWSMRSNFVDIPTDCPQRDERLGWTGDLQVFAPTASYLFDCSGFLAGWLKDLEIEQRRFGTVPWYVPVIPGAPEWTPVRPGALWGDVAVLTPWVAYERFGDAGIVAQQYTSARSWIDQVDRLSGPSHLWRSGQQLGDWLDPTAPPDQPAAAMTDPYLVSTAYFALSARRLAASATLLGHSDDASRYATLADEVATAFRSEYFTSDAQIVESTQTALSLAIAFGLLEDAGLAGRTLAELVRAGGNTIGTGFAGTNVILDALTSTGHLQTAYALLLCESTPSWLSMVNKGATTIWERWDSMLDDGSVNPGGMTSFNHYALGSVADWMHRVIGGLEATAPGYRSVRIAPRPGGRLTWAEARHESPYGVVSCSWRIADDVLTVTATLPTGVDGIVDLGPETGPMPITSGTHVFTVAWKTDHFTELANADVLS